MLEWVLSGQFWRLGTLQSTFCERKRAYGCTTATFYSITLSGPLKSQCPSIWIPVRCMVHARPSRHQGTLKPTDNVFSVFQTTVQSFLVEHFDLSIINDNVITKFFSSNINSTNWKHFHTWKMDNFSSCEVQNLDWLNTVLAEINAHPEISAHQNSWFSKKRVHKTDGFWWVISQRGEYTKPMAFDGWFFKEGSTQNRWVLTSFGMFFFASKN